MASQSAITIPNFPIAVNTPVLRAHCDFPFVPLLREKSLPTKISQKKSGGSEFFLLPVEQASSTRYFSRFLHVSEKRHIFPAWTDLSQEIISVLSEVSLVSSPIPQQLTNCDVRNPVLNKYPCASRALRVPASFPSGKSFQDFPKISPCSPRHAPKTRESPERTGERGPTDRGQPRASIPTASPLPLCDRWRRPSLRQPDDQDDRPVLPLRFFWLVRPGRFVFHLGHALVVEVVQRETKANLRNARDGLQQAGHG